MPYAIALLVTLVALARGGYAAWGILALEVGSAALVIWVVIDVLWQTSERERAVYRSQRGSPDVDVDIITPGTQPVTVPPKPPARYLVLLGFPFRKTHLAVPLLLLAAWVALSLVPLDRAALERLSPETLRLRGGEPGPSSVVPFVTLRSLWIALACFALVAVSAHAAAVPERAARLSLLLFCMGVGFGLYGMTQWLFGLQDLFGRDPTTASLRASASFGNRNHYAAFMEMLLLGGLGWAAAARAAIAQSARPSRRRAIRRLEDAGGKLFFLGLGVVVAGLGLVFSLSRSGITFGLASVAFLVLLLRGSGAAGRGARAGSPIGPAGIAAIALALVAVAAWIGLDPVVHRFRLLPDEWEAELGRSLVWRDSLGAVSDFLLTGSGLSTYRYVFPVYRSFGGTVDYSWAHNDYLQLLVELGLPGFLLFVWVAVSVVHRARQTRRRLESDPGLQAMHAGCLAALLAIGLHSFTDFGLHLAANAALFSVLVGMSIAMEPRPGRR